VIAAALIGTSASGTRSAFKPKLGPTTEKLQRIILLQKLKKLMSKTEQRNWSKF
jgi:hypothetical protein